MKQQVFGFILEASHKPLIRLDREKEQEVVRLMAALLTDLLETGKEGADGKSTKAR